MESIKGGRKMGYRLAILCPGVGKSPDLGKFYGYVIHDKLKSIKYLIDNHLLPDDDPDIFYYNEFGPDIILTAEQFREFIDLYQEDINNHDFSNDGIKYEKPFKLSSFWPLLDEAYKNDLKKIIYWG